LKRKMKKEELSDSCVTESAKRIGIVEAGTASKILKKKRKEFLEDRKNHPPALHRGVPQLYGYEQRACPGQTGRCE